MKMLKTDRQLPNTADVCGMICSMSSGQIKRLSQYESYRVYVRSFLTTYSISQVEIYTTNAARQSGNVLVTASKLNSGLGFRVCSGKHWLDIFQPLYFVLTLPSPPAQTRCQRQYVELFLILIFQPFTPTRRSDSVVIGLRNKEEIAQELFSRIMVKTKTLQNGQVSKQLSVD